DVVTLPLAVGRRGLDRDAFLTFQVHVVHLRADAVLALDVVDGVGLSRVEEDALGERGLARVDMGGDPDIADLFELHRGHVSLPYLNKKLGCPARADQAHSTWELALAVGGAPSTLRTCPKVVSSPQRSAARSYAGSAILSSALFRPGRSGRVARAPGHRYKGGHDRCARDRKGHCPGPPRGPDRGRGHPRDWGSFPGPRGLPGLCGQDDGRAAPDGLRPAPALPRQRRAARAGPGDLYPRGVGSAEGESAMTEELKKWIDEAIAKDRVVIFMKGSLHFPMCGFSRAAVETLRAAGATEIAAYNVLENPEL